MTLVSCKKEKLEGDTAILKGKWNWTETYGVSNHCDPETSWNYQLVDMSEPGSTYTLEFYEKGKVYFSHNDGTIWNRRTIFDEDEQATFTSGPYEYKFEIWLNNDSKDPMEVYVGQDSMLVNDFPKDTETECEEYFNHFVRG